MHLLHHSQCSLVSCMRDMLGKIALVSLDGHRTFLPVLSSFQAGASLLQFLCKVDCSKVLGWAPSDCESSCLVAE